MPWIGFNWRYDSGLVAGAVPCYGVCRQNNCPDSTTLPNGQPAVNLSGLSADQQFQAGLFCGRREVQSVRAAAVPVPGNAVWLQLCFRSRRRTRRTTTTTRPRMRPRNLFDMALGDDNLFSGDKYKWSLQVTLINLTNKVRSITSCPRSAEPTTSVRGR